MFDTHYDLLTIAYVAYLKNDYSYLEKISKYFNENNVVGVFANLYFMSLEEMASELDENYYRDDVSVLEMFSKAKEVLDTYLPDTSIVYSIEGADYIRDSKELENLYDVGLDSLILCWNNDSKYASRKDGLTKDGRELLDKCVELGIAIDLSHASRKTFSDMIDYIEANKDKDIVCFASHSNAYGLCPRSRNLTDKQIKKLGEVGGLVGVFSNKNFVVMKDEANENTNYKKAYLDHIEHIAQLITSDNVMVATDDMNFAADYDSEYGRVSIYDYETIGSELAFSMVEKYGLKNTNKMLNENAKKVFNKIKERRFNKNRGVNK